MYGPAAGWRIIDYKTDQSLDPEALTARYAGQLEQYAEAWRIVTREGRATGALFAVRTGALVPLSDPGPTSGH